jgi:hypothetical protein
MFWIKNTRGKPDSMLTFSTISFFVVVFNIILATIGGFQIGDFSITFQPMDAGAMGVFLGATFTAYVSKRATDVAADAYVNKGKKNKKEEEVIDETKEP